MNKIINNLLSIKQKLDEFESERRKTELYNSNRFNPFRFMRTDEIGLSNILAFLLDPEESHGQGDLFLNSFLKYIGKHKFLAFDSVNVITEKVTKENRRHDIVVEGLLENKLHWIISIENKLNFANDQPKQLKDYLDDLKQKRAEYCLIYLPVYEHNPSDISIPPEEWEILIHNNEAILLSAEKLIDWLDKTPIFSPPVEQFCNYFKKFLREDVMKNTQDSNNLADYLITNNVALSAALAIFDSKNTIYEKLINKLKEQLESKINSNTHLKSIYDEFKFQFQVLSPHQKGGGIRFGNDIFGICLYFNNSDFHDAYYGIYSDEKLFECLKDIYNDVTKQTDFVSYKSGNNSFPLWRYLKGNYRQWDASVFSEITNGKLANYIFEELWKPLLDIISNNFNEIKKLENK